MPDLEFVLPKDITPLESIAIRKIIRGGAQLSSRLCDWEDEVQHLREETQDILRDYQINEVNEQNAYERSKVINKETIQDVGNGNEPRPAHITENERLDSKQREFCNDIVHRHRELKVEIDSKLYKSAIGILNCLFAIISPFSEAQSKELAAPLEISNSKPSDNGASKIAADEVTRLQVDIKAQLEATKKRQAILEKEINIMELGISLESKRKELAEDSKEFLEARSFLAKLQFDSAERKNEYEKLKSAWDAKWGKSNVSEHSTVIKLEPDDAEAKLQAANQLLDIQAQELEKYRANYNGGSEYAGLSEHDHYGSFDRDGSPVGISSIASEIAGNATLDKDTVIKKLQEQIEFYEPLYRVGYYVRARKYEQDLRHRTGHSSKLITDKGTDLIFGGSVIADATMYLDRCEKDKRRSAQEFEFAYQGVPAAVVWEHRNFQTFIALLTSGGDMDRYNSDTVKGARFSSPAMRKVFDESFNVAFKKIYPDFKISTDKEAREDEELKKALKVMTSELANVAQQAKRGGLRG